MSTHVRFTTASLTEPISPETADRNTLGMSTLLDTDEFLAEAEWVNGGIGDVKVYRNQNCLNGRRATDENGQPLPDAWKYWAGVPAAKVRCYRLREEHAPGSPMTLKAPADGKREAKSGQAAEKQPATA